MDIDFTSIIMPIIAPKIESYKDVLVNFAKSRFLVTAQEYGMNDKESDALMQIADDIDVQSNTKGQSVYFNIEYGSNHYLGIIENGMPAPLTGGSGGIAMNPDGSTYKSNVPVPLQGNPIESFLKEGKDVIGEIETMAKSIGRDIINDAVQDSKHEISVAVKTYLVPKIQEAIGGGS